MKAKPIWVMGMMSGTSLDGVDAALLKTDGTEILEFGETAYRSYSKKERAVLRNGLGAWQGAPTVEPVSELVELAHVETAQKLPGAELLGFHGQTLAHDPRNGKTHQAGDGRVLSEALGCPVVWDFRSTDVEMGGEGAPLAPVFHFAAVKWAKISAPVAILNLGGVGNLTIIDPSYDKPEEPGALLAFDTGPANALINDLMVRETGKPFDKNGDLARSGKIQRKVLKRFRKDSYFARIPPKSLDRDTFAWLDDAVKGYPVASAAATLTEVSALALLMALEHCPVRPKKLYVTGGGRNNSFMMERISALTSIPATPIEDIGLDGDMLEAQAFAYLAARVYFGLPTSFPSTTGVATAIGGGQISRPS